MFTLCPQNKGEFVDKTAQWLSVRTERFRVQISAQRLAIPSEGFHGFPQSLQTMSNEEMDQESKTGTSHKAYYLAGIRRIKITNQNCIYLMPIILLEKLIVCSAIQEYLCLLWNQKIYYSVHKSLALAPILSQMYPIYNLQHYFPKIIVILACPLCQDLE
jgi:hypothetical protein